MRLARRKVKARGIAQGIAARMDLGGQAALAAAYGLAFSDVFSLLTPFLCAPAEC